MNEFTIGDRIIGGSQKPYFIADIAANHDGNLDRAKKLIELAKEAGADAVKFQNFTAETIVSRTGFSSMQDSLSHQKSWSKPVFEVYRDASIPGSWTQCLKEKCDEIDIEYMTSPYDFESVDLVDPFSKCFKIGSGDITWIQLLEYIAQKKKPVLLATGASSMEDVARAMRIVQNHTSEIVLMQCNTNYTGLKDNFNYLNLNVLQAYRNQFPDTVLGLSDHTPGHVSVLGAIALGARVIEKHFTDDTGREGPDHKFSMTPQTWRDMVMESGFLFDSLGDGIKKIEHNELETAIVQRRALYYTQDLRRGDVVKESDFFPLRPIQKKGLPPYLIGEVVGKTLRKDVNADQGVSMEDFEEC